ncbi:MAG TPA: GyrI-like domain-containing protein [Pseudonocardia sp.]
MTTSQPSIVERESQPYVAVRGVVTAATFPAIADRIPEVFSWLAARGIAPDGPPFFRYLVIDAPDRLEVEAGVPTATSVAGEGDVVAGVLPAGRFATTTHLGDYAGLADTTAELLAWAEEHDEKWDVAKTRHGERWGCRLAVLQTSPRFAPDPADWLTDLVFRLAD